MSVSHFSCICDYTVACLVVSGNSHLVPLAGPGPVPALDGENIVMGCVLEGLGTVAQVANVPTFQPSDRTQALNQIASLIGDSRAAKARHALLPLSAASQLGSLTSLLLRCRGQSGL